MFTWDYKHGGSAYTPDSVLLSALDSGTVAAVPSTETQFTIAYGDNTVIFEGAFATDYGVLTGGTITGFHVYSGDALLLDVSGYAIDLDDFINGNEAIDGNGLSFFNVARTVIGSADDDIINCYLWNDRVYGNAGADYVFGDEGNDFVSGGDGEDSLAGGDGADTVDYSEKTQAVFVALSIGTKSEVSVGGVVEDTIDTFENANGGRGNDHIAGNGLSNRLVGNAGADLVAGGAGNDVLLGGAGQDTLRGGAGNDILSGGKASDVLAGGAGNDHFNFGVTPVAGVADRIVDFSHGHDLIGLDAGFFPGMATGYLKAGYFHIGPTAGDGNDRIIYNQSTGALYYDKDGVGSAAQIQFAVLAHHPAITAHDFLVY